MPAGDGLVGVDKRLLARGEVGGGDCALERRLHFLRCVELQEGRAEPLRVWRVPALEQKAEPHDVPCQPSREHPRAELVSDLGGASDERLLLVEPPPLGGEQPEPDVARVPHERGAKRLQLAETVVEDRSARDLEQELLRRRQPVAGLDPMARVEAEALLEPRAERRYVHPMPYLVVVPAVANRPAAEGLRKARLQVEVRVGEDLQPRAPAVVGRALGVVAEDVRAVPEKTCGVPYVAQEPDDDLLVERARELAAGQELRHGRASRGRSPARAADRSRRAERTRSRARAGGRRRRARTPRASRRAVARTPRRSAASVSSLRPSENAHALARSKIGSAATAFSQSISPVIRPFSTRTLASCASLWQRTAVSHPSNAASRSAKYRFSESRRSGGPLCTFRSTRRRMYSRLVGNGLVTRVSM